MLRFNFILGSNFISICFKVIITHIHYLEEIWFIITEDLIEPCEVFIPGGLA